MIKRIFYFLVFVISLFLIGVYFHKYLNTFYTDTSRFTEISIYSFHAIASAVIYILIEFCFKYLPNQTGYSFLALMSIKLGLFMLLFSHRIYNGFSLNYIEKFVLIVPLFIFLITETIALALLLNNAKFTYYHDS